MAYFALKRGEKAEYLYRPRVFLWIPHVLIPNGLEGIRCPKCYYKCQTAGYNKNPHARRVVDLYG